MFKELLELTKIYQEYLILCKNGGFYISLDNSAIILHRLFGFKILKNGSHLKAGFPIKSLDKITNMLEIERINYVIYDGNNIIKKEFFDNKYNLYKIDKYNLYMERIEYINKTLKGNIDSGNIEKILLEVEQIICKINY